MDYAKQIEAAKALIEKTPAALQWQKIGIRPHHGIALPLFSLHSEKSGGIGEFPDLVPLMGWCKEIGLDLIQLLPLNDTGHDTSPYSALSAFALNPVHLGLASLPNVQESSLLLSILHDLKHLNATQQVDLARLRPLRQRFLEEYFCRFRLQICALPEYNAFEEEEKDWLNGYALFKALKQAHGCGSFEHWPEELKNPSQEAIQEHLTKHENEVSFHKVVQFLCFRQMKQVKAIAEKQGVFLKGDIPILINRESADVWLNRSLFRMEYSAGAPPDMYAKEGQKWGFPTYNWEEMEAQGYKFWKRRLQVAEQIFHLYRLDHIVGFYRIFSIPIDKNGAFGHFVPEERASWIPHGEKILRMMLESSTMLPIGEDLGTIPPEVRMSLARLGISGTKVMRWERDFDHDKHFIPIKDYPLLSLTTVSTHDSEPLQLWWETYPDEAKEFAISRGWVPTKKMVPSQDLALLYDSHHSGSLFHINLLQEYLALVPGMTHPDPADERINVPGTISNTNWTYRFVPTVNEIISNPQLAALMQQLI